jgi:hypothetical protein
MTNGTRRECGISVTPRQLFIPGKDPVPIVQEAGWAPGLVWTGAEYLAPTRIRSADRPARSQSLYRLSYLADSVNVLCQYFSKHSRKATKHVTQNVRVWWDGAGRDGGCHNFLSLFIIRRNFGKHVITGVANIYKIRDFRFLQRCFRRFRSSEKLHSVAALNNYRRFEASYRLFLRIKQQNIIGHPEPEDDGTEVTYYPTIKF